MNNRTHARWPKRLLCLALAIVFVFFSARVYYRLTDDFRLVHITHNLPFYLDAETVVTAQDKELLDKISKQPFTYIGKGAQSYAFLSEDGEHVLKFFKFKHLKPHWLVQYLPNIGPFKEVKEKSIARKKRQFHSVFDGYQLAYDRHRKESGLLYIHLSSTNEIGQSVELFDKIGRRHILDMDANIFVVQERVVVNRHAMKEALNNGDLALAKLRIHQIVNHYLAEYDKGIYDRDHGVLHNMGFIGDRTIRLDVGKLSRAPRMKEQENWEPDLKIVALKYHHWMKDKYPEYYDEVISSLEQELAKAFGKPYQISE